MDNWNWNWKQKEISTDLVSLHSYRVTLNQNEKTEDENQRDKDLKACHQRCADRTLKVLEKNGSIFIKLGQHLVCLFIHIIFLVAR